MHAETPMSEANEVSERNDRSRKEVKFYLLLHTILSDACVLNLL